MYNLFVFFQFWPDLHVFPLGLPTFLHFSLDFLVFLSRSFQGERAQMMNSCMNQKRTNETPMMFFPVCFWLFVNLFVRVILNLPCLFWILQLLFFGGLCIFSCVSLISSFFGCAIACHGFASFDVFGGFAVHLTLSPLVINLLVVGEALCPHSPAPPPAFSTQQHQHVGSRWFCIVFCTAFPIFWGIRILCIVLFRFGRGPF